MDFSLFLTSIAKCARLKLKPLILFLFFGHHGFLKEEKNEQCNNGCVVMLIMVITMMMIRMTKTQTSIFMLERGLGKVDRGGLWRTGGQIQIRNILIWIQIQILEI